MIKPGKVGPYKPLKSLLYPMVGEGRGHCVALRKMVGSGRSMTIFRNWIRAVEYSTTTHVALASPYVLRSVSTSHSWVSKHRRADAAYQYSEAAPTNDSRYASIIFALPRATATWTATAETRDVSGRITAATGFCMCDVYMYL